MWMSRLLDVKLMDVRIHKLVNKEPAKLNHDVAL
jgi:hypothetical protein